MIISKSLPGIKQFLQPLGRRSRVDMLVRMVTAFIVHSGKMSASQAGEAIRCDSRHRANVGRYLGRRYAISAPMLNRLQRRIIQSQLRHAGDWFFVLDQTYVGHQGQKTENTFSRANYRPRPKNSNRRQKKTAHRSCHGFVMGLLITPSGCRIPFFKSYYTRSYCLDHGLPYRTQTELGAELIRELPLPREIHVIVLGDTAYEAKTIRRACGNFGYSWITPINPERVLAGEPPRPKVSTIINNLRATDLIPVRLGPTKACHATQHRVALCRSESRTQHRTFYVHGERRDVHRVGRVQLVFSTNKKCTPNQPVKIQKVLMTNETRWSARYVVQCYDVRWQIELMFKELKSTLGMNHYQFRTFLKVDRYVRACLVTFLYLEWFRNRTMQQRSIPKEERRRCAAQRTHGLARIVRHKADLNDLRYIARACRTTSGIRKLRRQIQNAIPFEYRSAQN